MAKLVNVGNLPELKALWNKIDFDSLASGWGSYSEAPFVLAVRIMEQGEYEEYLLGQAEGISSCAIENDDALLSNNHGIEHKMLQSQNIEKRMMHERNETDSTTGNQAERLSSHIDMELIRQHNPIFVNDNGTRLNEISKSLILAVAISMGRVLRWRYDGKWTRMASIWLPAGDWEGVPKFMEYIRVDGTVLLLIVFDRGRISLYQESDCIHSSVPFFSLPTRVRILEEIVVVIFANQNVFAWIEIGQIRHGKRWSLCRLAERLQTFDICLLKNDFGICITEALYQPTNRSQYYVTAVGYKPPISIHPFYKTEYGNLKNDHQGTKVQIIPNIHQFVDSKRCIDGMCPNPKNPRIAATTDSYGRVLIVHLPTLRVLRVFSTYRSGQVAWLVGNKGKQSYLLIYSAKRALAECWDIQKNIRLHAFLTSDSKVRLFSRGGGIAWIFSPNGDVMAIISKDN